MNMTPENDPSLHKDGEGHIWPEELEEMFRFMDAGYDAD